MEAYEKKSNAPTLSYEEMERLAWQTIVLSRHAKREGIKIGDDEVRAEVERLFSTQGIFNPVFYEDWVEKNMQGRPRDFEESVRKHLAAQKIRGHVLAGVPEKERQNRWLQWLSSVLAQSQFQGNSEGSAAQN